MKILLVASEWLPVPAVEGGAIETLVEAYLNYNEKIYHDSIDVYSIATKIDIDLSNYQYTNFIYIKNNTFMYLLKKVYYKLINNVFKKYNGNAFLSDVLNSLKKRGTFNKYDLVLVENGVQFIPILKKKLNCKIVLQLHNDYLNHDFSYYKEVYDSCDKILTVSDFISSRVNPVKNDKVSTVHTGVNYAKFNKVVPVSDIIQMREKYQISDNDLIFIYIGRIIPIKGVKELVEAFNCLSKHYFNIKLLVVGSSSFKNAKESDYVKEVMSIADGNNNIIFTGFIDNSELPILYKFCDVAICPSICNDAYPLSPIEAIVSNKCVIATMNGGIPEIVDEQTGFLVDSDNLKNNLIEVIDKIIKNPKLIIEKSNKSDKLRDKFDEVNYVDRLHKELEKIWKK